MKGIRCAVLCLLILTTLFFSNNQAITEELRIEAIEFPKTARAGETVAIRIQTNEPDALVMRYGCAGVKQGAYAPVTVLDETRVCESSEALTGSLHKTIRFTFPDSASHPQGYILWARGAADWATLRWFKNNNEVFKRSFRIGSHTQTLQWARIADLTLADAVDCFELRVDKGKGLDCIIASPDTGFNPEYGIHEGTIGMQNNQFHLTMPQLLAGPQNLLVWAKRGDYVAHTFISIDVDDFTPAIASDDSPETNLPNNSQWVDLKTVANLAANSDQVCFLDEKTIADRHIQVGESSYTIPTNEHAFVGVWKHIDEKVLKERSVSVAQADDKVRVAQSLPENVVIPINAKAGVLYFLHAEKGAGELGDDLWQYEITLADGTTQAIVIREGQQVSGYLKSEETEDAELVLTSLVNNAPAKVYLWRWENPSPDAVIKCVRMTAIRDKIIPVLLGIAFGSSSADTGGINAVKPAMVMSEHVRVEANFLNAVRPVRRGLFSMNNPYLTATNGITGRGLQLVYGHNEWKRYEQMGFVYDRIWIGGLLPKIPDGQLEHTASYELVNEAMIKIGKHTNTRIILNINPPKWCFSEEPGLDQRLDRLCEFCVAIIGEGLKSGWPVEYVELFNETLIGHSTEEIERKYRCFNRLASALKKTFPTLKITGTAECWPAVGVLEQFVKHCGENLDALSWHLYPTGNVTTPTNVLMKATSQFAAESKRVGEMLNRVIPDRPISQLITEYNINYAAWKQGGEKRQNNGVGATWLLSVMRHLLYDGNADVANYWHYEFGTPYSIGRSPKAKLSPMGQTLFLLNHYASGNLVQTETSSPSIECLAVDNDSDCMLAVINVSEKTQQVDVSALHFPMIISEDQGATVRIYSVAGEDADYHCELLQEDTLAGGHFSLTMPAFSTFIYLLSKP